MSDQEPDIRTAIATADETSITVRDRDLTTDLVGSTDFGAFFYLIVTGEEPTPGEARLCNAMLVTIAEHGMTPSATAARLTYSAAPEAPQGAIASGLAGAGGTLLGSMQAVAEILQAGVARVEDGEDVDAVAADVVATHDTLPGFGHPSHSPTDPRTDRLFDLLEAEGLAGEHYAMIHTIQDAMAKATGSRLLINATGAIGAVSSDLDLDPIAARGIAVVARAAGLTAHLSEEADDPMAWSIWSAVEDHTTYTGDVG